MPRVPGWSMSAVRAAAAAAPDTTPVIAPARAPLDRVTGRRVRSRRPPSPRRALARYPLVPVLLVAAILGSTIDLLLGADPYANADSHAFEAIARSLLAGRGLVYSEPMFPDLALYAFRSPGYSTFLALALALGGVTAVVALQGALHGVSSALVGSLAGRWAGTRAAWLACAIHFVWPAGWFHAGQLMSESFFEFVTILAVWCVVRAEQRRRLRWAVAAGAAVAVAVLTRPVGLGCAAAVAIWLLMRYPRAAGVFALTAVLTWLPWPIRNAERLHAFVPLLTSGGNTAWNMRTNQEPIVAWTWMSRHTELGELGLDRHFRDATAAAVRADPLGTVQMIARSASQYVGPLKVRDASAWLHRFALLAVLPALFVTGWRRRLRLPVMVWACEGLLLVPVAMHSRYRFPTEWCVVVCAAIGLQAMAARWGPRRMWMYAAAALVACVVFSLVTARA